MGDSVSVGRVDVAAPAPRGFLKLVGVVPAGYPWLRLLQVGSAISLVYNFGAALFYAMFALTVMASGQDSRVLPLLWGSSVISLLVVWFDVMLLQHLASWKRGEALFWLPLVTGGLQLLVFPVGTLIGLLMLPSLMDRRTRLWLRGRDGSQVAGSS